MALSPQDAARTHAAMRCAPSPQPSIFPSDFRLHHHTHAALRATHGPAHIRSAAPWQVALLIGCALTASSSRCRHSRRSLRDSAGRWLARPQCPIFRASGRRPTACCRVPTRRRAAVCKKKECALLADDDASLADLEALLDCAALQAAAAITAEWARSAASSFRHLLCILLCALLAMRWL